ncbi:MAG: transcription termination factor Rho, partial [Ilumatobacter sp.]
KTQLMQIAEALGVKASTRNKKAEIIDQILAKTGGVDAVAPVPTPSEQASTRPKPTDERVPGDEPKAEWELAVDDASTDDTAAKPGARWVSKSDSPGDGSPQAESKSDGSSSGDASPKDSTRDGATSNDDSSRGGRSGSNRSDGQQSDGETDNRESRQGEGARNRNRNANQGGGNRNPNQGNQNSNSNSNNNQGNESDGESRNKRRRRRRKNRGGQDGPQGEDRDLLEVEEPTENLSTEPVKVDGYLDLRDEGYGFVRVNNYLASKSDSYIPVMLSRQYGLRKGDHVVGMSRPAGRNEKNPAMLDIQTVNGRPPEEAKKRPRFEDLTALFPDSQLRLENPADPTDMTARIIDLVCPIGKGQRGIIVSPPKAGKTSVMKTIVSSVEANNPECKVIVLLIDERPEEVTDMKRMAKGEVIASTFDKPSDQHTQIAEMTIEKAKRMVEYGEDVVVMLDGITRLSRAYNLAAPASGRILSGGIDAGALYPPKKFFGAARNVEEGGSLTILATALVETNSRMDEAVFEEFKGTGNMELRLDRKLAERRIYPAIDVDASSTRHEELLFDRKQLQMVWKLRRVLSGLAADGNAAPGLELLVDRLRTFRTNEEFLTEIAKQPGM